MTYEENEVEEAENVLCTTRSHILTHFGVGRLERVCSCRIFWGRRLTFEVLNEIKVWWTQNLELLINQWSWSFGLMSDAAEKRFSVVDCEWLIVDNFCGVFSDDFMYFWGFNSSH